jgi:hypothetical protein
MRNINATKTNISNKTTLVARVRTKILSFLCKKIPIIVWTTIIKPPIAGR